MVDRRICTFCGAEIEPGTGRMYIKKDGVVYNFCTSKCYKNLVVLGRVPRRTTWTRYYEREKGVRMKGAPAEEEAPKARKVRKVAAKPEEASKEEAAEAPKETPKEKAKEEPAEKPKPKAEPKAEEKKPEPKEAPKKEKPAAQKKSEPAKKPKAEAKPKPAEGADK